MALTTRNRFSRFIAALYESAVPSRDCHVGRWPPRNDKPLAFAILTAACFLRRCSAGPGCPLPYNTACGRRWLVRAASAFPRLPRRFAPRNDTSGQRSNGNGAAHRIGGTTAASRTGLAVPAPTGPVRIERRPAYDPFFILHSSVFIIHYFIHPPAGDGKPYDKTSGNSLPFVQISPEPPDLSLTTGAFIDKIISENKGAVCPLQQARQPAKNLFVTHDPNTRDQYRRTTQWIKNASLP